MSNIKSDAAEKNMHAVIKAIEDGHRRASAIEKATGLGSRETDRALQRGRRLGLIRFMSPGGWHVATPAASKRQPVRPCCERDHDGGGNCDRHHAAPSVRSGAKAGAT